MKCKKSIDNSARYIAMQSELHDWEQWGMRAKVLNSNIAARVGIILFEFLGSTNVNP